MYEEDEDFIHTKFGYCYYELTPVPFIYNLYVYEKYRRMGHSRKLLGMVIAEIRESGYDGVIHIEAQPVENNVALDVLVKLYESLGLEVDNVHRNAES